MSKKNILLIEPTIRHEGVKILSENFNTIFAPNGQENTLVEYIQRDIEAIIVRTEHITQNIIKSGKSLKIIAQNGVGVDNIDVNTATEEKIAVINVPNANSLSVGEHVAMFILTLSKNLFSADKAVRTGHWSFRDSHLPTEIFRKNGYLIGFGNNAQATAQVLVNGFGMSLRAYDPYVSAKKMQEYNVEKVENIYDGFSSANFISVHVPLTPNTFHLIDDVAFSKMKNAFFINCSRGPVVKTSSLCWALKNKYILGAGLDVFEDEPPDTKSEIFQFDNVITTPHFAGDTLEAKQRCAITLANDVVKALNNSLPTGLYNNQLEYLFN